jgi:glycosyltransferase involved in cell wall biosynthesis
MSTPTSPSAAPSAAAHAAPLDILFVLPSLEQGGAERVAINLANALQAAGHRPRFLLTNRPGALASQLDPAIPVTAIGRPRVRAAMPGILRRVRAAPPDVILATHTHLNLALCATRGALPTRVRLVLREPTHAPRTLDGRSTRWRRLAQRMLYRRADLILATSRPMQADLRRLSGIRVEVLHNPVDTDAIRDRLNLSPAQHALRPDRSARWLVSVGRLATQKSLPDLLRAFAAASDPADRLVLVGDGPLRAELTDLAEALGVADRVELPGFLREPWPVVAAADALLLVSQAEGMPNVVLEALAVGTPVIATDELDVLCDLRDAAPPGAVRLVPRRALADAIQAVVPFPQPGTTGDAGVPAVRPMLLPEAYLSRTAGRRLEALLEDLVAERAPRADD